jgi:hypothetical protein
MVAGGVGVAAFAAVAAMAVAGSLGLVVVVAACLGMSVVFLLAFTVGLGFVPGTHGSAASAIMSGAGEADERASRRRSDRARRNWQEFAARHRRR